jgi:hypothetical protein
LIGGGAALLVAALAVVFLVLKPFGSASFEGKPASAVLSQLMADGFCPVPDTRSGFTDYPTLLSYYDADTLRGCTDSKNGNYFFIYANQSPSDLADEIESSSNTQNVFGKDWIIEFVGSDNAAVLGEIAQKYNILQTPTTFVLDDVGAVAARIGGSPRPDALTTALQIALRREHDSYII